MVLVRRRDLSRNLTADEGDGNTDDLDGRITAIEDNPPVAASIDDITVVGNQMTITLTDYTTFTVTVPTSSWRPRGEFANGLTYLTGDVFTADGSFWLTIFDHTTATPFDAGANDGMGHSYYSFIFSLTQPNTGIIKTTSDAITTILAHAEKYVRCNSSTGTEITILSDATADHVIGTVIEYRLGVSGMSMTFVPETGGVTINYPEDDFDLVASKKGAVIAIRKVDDDEWDVFGLLDPITGS